MIICFRQCLNGLAGTMPGTKHDEGWIQLHWLDSLLGSLRESCRF